jgi:c-di-GMP-binding flagellar brake protein YcgR
MEERRSGTRYELMAQVQVRKKDISEIMEVKNISVTGVLIATTDRSQIDAFTIDSIVDVDIFSTQNLKNISVSGRIVRGQKSGDKYSFGIEFVELTQAQIAGISELVEVAFRLSGQPPLLPFQS